MGTSGARPATRSAAADGARRVFLGWDGRPSDAGADAAWRSRLACAADWIADDLAGELGADLSSVLVALPGRRAARRLEQLVARRLSGRGDAFVPARFVTVGRLVDELLARPAAVAGRLARTLAWGAALADCPRDELAGLIGHPPEDDDATGRHRLAGELRALHGRLAPEGLDFAAVRDALAATPDAGRWQVLARLARAYREGLDALGLRDPHDLRRAAVERGELAAGRRVVLVGAPELNDLTRRALSRIDARVDALVFAPAALADRFDAFGAVAVEAWEEAEIELDVERWSVEDGPGDQADAALARVAGCNGRYSAAQVTLGVPDAQVVPELEARLAALAVSARSAAGRPLRASAPWRLLALLADWRDRARFADLAALVRHPDLHRRLREALGADPASICDDHAARHLPGAVPVTWPGDPDEAALLARLHATLEGWLAPLPPGEGPICLAEAAGGALQVLRHVYGATTLDVAAREEDRRLADALEELRDALLEVEGAPAALAGRPFGDVAAALGAILQDCAGRSVPPPADEGAIELLGWLELPLDDAPALVVTGFNGGRVPSAPADDPFLSDAVRRHLGLPEERARRARDAYLLQLLVRSREELHLVSGRRTREGDPLRPSRLAFHRPEASVPEAVMRFVRGGRVRRVRDEVPPAAARRVARPLPPPAPLTSISVTAFRDHLRSPYHYALRHGPARLESVDDGALELDGALFGTLAHDVLRGLDGRGAASRSTDAEEVERFLVGRLRALARERFGAHAQPAVAVQVEQLAARLRRFAAWQAARAADGWEIAAAEWAPTAEAWAGAGRPPDGRDDGSVPFDVDGEMVALRGRIDRVDVHPASGAWALLDYKTSDEGRGPRQVHGPRRGSGRWDDLQLPLYRLLCRPVPAAWTGRGADGARPPQLGFLALSRQVQEGDDGPLQPGTWSDEELADAEETARQVVRAIRAGDFPLGDFPDHDPILAAVAGIGLLSGPDDDGEDGP